MSSPPTSPPMPTADAAAASVTPTSSIRRVSDGGASDTAAAPRPVGDAGDDTNNASGADRYGGVMHALHPTVPDVAFVVPRSDVRWILELLPDGSVGTRALAPRNITTRREYTLCPSCLPDDDPDKTADCPNRMPVPPLSPDEEGAYIDPIQLEARGSRCPHMHAKSARIQRYEAQRREGAEEKYDRFRWEFSGAVPTIAIGRAHVSSGPYFVDWVPLNRCLRTQTTSILVSSQEEANAAAEADQIHVAAFLEREKKDPPRETRTIGLHCAHWAVHGLCAYGSTCQFVHALDVSETSVRSFSARYQKKDRRKPPAPLQQPQQARPLPNSLNRAAGGQAPPVPLLHHHHQMSQSVSVAGVPTPVPLHHHHSHHFQQQPQQPPPPFPGVGGAVTVPNFAAQHQHHQHYLHHHHHHQQQQHAGQQQQGMPPPPFPQQQHQQSQSAGGWMGQGHVPFSAAPHQPLAGYSQQQQQQQQQHAHHGAYRIQPHVQHQQMPQQYHQHQQQAGYGVVNQPSGHAPPPSSVGQQPPLFQHPPSPLQQPQPQQMPQPPSAFTEVAVKVPPTPPQPVSALPLPPAGM